MGRVVGWVEKQDDGEEQLRRIASRAEKVENAWSY